jgi:23S rRNA pseudouridine1911/1915/1917 synthase
MISEEQLENFDNSAEGDQEDLFEHHRIVVDKGQSLIRIDKFLSITLANTSRSRIQNAAESGSILVNAKPVKSNYKIKPNDVISIVLAYPPHETGLIAENLPIDIVYQDKDLFIVNKPAGLVVHPAHGHYNGTLMNAVAYLMYPEMLGKPIISDSVRPGLVHRIDKNTSGLMVLGRTEVSTTFLAKQFFDRTINRLYVALVWGDVKDDEGTIIGNIGRSHSDRKIRQVFPDGEEGKHAVTHYKVLERFGYVTLIQCKLETGRTHQIRVHMKYLGHPLFNDDTYGGDKILKGTVFSKYRQFVENCFAIMPRHALHARSLGFIHPTTKKDMNFDSEVADDMKAVVEKWRSYSSNVIKAGIVEQEDDRD